MSVAIDGLGGTDVGRERVLAAARRIYEAHQRHVMMLGLSWDGFGSWEQLPDVSQHAFIDMAMAALEPGPGEGT